jgi:hypothetical protein
LQKFTHLFVAFDAPEQKAATPPGIFWKTFLQTEAFIAVDTVVRNFIKMEGVFTIRGIPLTMTSKIRVSAY